MFKFSNEILSKSVADWKIEDYIFGNIILRINYIGKDISSIYRLNDIGIVDGEIIYYQYV